MQEAAEYLRNRTGKKEWPKIALVMGTGLGHLVSDTTPKYIIPYSEIPHWQSSTVESHAGNFLLGRFFGMEMILLQGRLHYYEGYSMEEVTFPIRVLQALGIQRLILTNASGGVNPNFRAGDLVCIQDHINLFPEHPLRGPNDSRLGLRFPDLSSCYAQDMNHRAMMVGHELGIRIHEGVYVGLQGPSLETPAEYRMIRLLGGDCVGMSTVPEAIVAAHAGMRVWGLSIISNDTPPPGVIQPITLEDVIAVVEKASGNLKKILSRCVGYF